MWFVFSSSSDQKTFLSIIYQCMEWDVTVWYMEYTATVLLVVSPLVDVWDVHSTNQTQTSHLYTVYNVMDGRILLF